MIKSIVFLLLLLSSIDVWSQITITGTVKDKSDRSILPGVNVVEKGTMNGTVSTMEGTFMLTVTNANAIVVFSFIGYITQEVHLNGQNKIAVKLKSDCIRDFFDHQTIKINTANGLLYTPLGGGFEVSFPAFLRDVTLKSGISYQSNLSENRVINAHISLDHLVVKCDFDTDFRWYYRSVRWGNKLHSTAYSFESNFTFDPSFNFNDIRVIIGYSAMNFNKPEILENKFTSGPLIGLGTWIGEPLRIQVTGKASIYKGLAEYQGEINRQFKRIYTFARVYKLQSFTEVSIGAGIEFYYRFKSQRIRK